MSSATTKWIALALLGLAIAAAVAFLASRLVSEQIGIASESVSAGYDLAPAVRSATTPPRGDGAPARDEDGTTSETPSTGNGESTGADQREDEIEDREKEREDALDDAEDEREDREDEVRDLEEERRDD
jgi:hypothetical protein